jgi:hypothetical protein
MASTQIAGSEMPLDFAAGWREPGKRSEAAETAQEVAVGDIEPGGAAPDPGVTTSVTMIDFRGYAYTRGPSPISGALVTTYDPTTPQTWHVPFRRDITPSLTVVAPRSGYIVPAAYAQEVGQKLKLHGIRFERFTVGVEKMAVDAFRATRADFSTTPFEGRQRVTLHGAWQSELRDVPPSSLFVPIRQVTARLIMALLEPQAPDSFAAWGFFNACFEQKEYMEPYVAETIAQEMLNRDPQLALSFNRRLNEDAEFAGDPVARLEFFYRRHASWDERLNLYPVYRSQTRR